MADLIMGVIEVTVWLLDETVFAVVCVMDGLIAVLTYLPSLLINVFFFVELIILGILSSIRLIVASLWFSVSFLFQIPFNLGNFFNSALSASRVCLLWSLQAFSEVAWRLHHSGYQILFLLRQVMSYVIDCFHRYSHKIVFKSSSVVTECLSYVVSKTAVLLKSVVDSLAFLWQWPFRVFLTCCETVASSVSLIILKLLTFLWNLLQVCFAKFSALLQFFSNFEATKFSQKTNSMYREYSTYGASWLTRFSQLMLAFSLLIFITAVLVILYHMRSKVLAAVANLLKLFTRKILQLLQNGQQGVDRRNRNRADLPLEYRRQELEDSGSEDEDAEGDFEQVGAVKEPQLRVDDPRGGSAERDVRGIGPGPSTGSTLNYEQLLQDERDKQLCVVCQDNEKDTLIFPCKHLCACNNCIEQITNSLVLDSRRCPLCRTKISSYLDVYT